jgi:hypothetical protein
VDAKAEPSKTIDHQAAAASKTETERAGS